jgi:hypothetical protein
VLGVIAGAITTALIGGIAWAAIPNAAGVVQGCYDSGGNVKVVNALPCPKGSTPFTFMGTTATASNADKLDGLDSTAFLGATATATDSDKLDGMDSSAFLTGESIDVEMVSDEPEFDCCYDDLDVIVTCPEGTRVVGGGYFVRGDDPLDGPEDVDVYFNGPRADNKWQVKAEGTLAGTHFLDVRAMCLRVETVTE